MVNFNRDKKSILLVEDNEDARGLTAFILNDYALSYARNFGEGLLLARRGYFDLYILDNWLPDGNGVELCRLIREFDPHTPILFYSAVACDRDILEGIRAGAQEYFVKPVRFDELKQEVARLISVPFETTFEARRAEVAAIREELAIQQMENRELREEAKENRLRSKEKALRLKAQIALDRKSTRLNSSHLGIS